jgi:pteridine reductase
MTTATTLPLAGLAVLITGGARRVGAAIARHLHAHGASLLIHHRASRADASALVGEFNAERPRSAAAHAADLLDVESLPALVAASIAAFGRLDVLINNASTFYPTPLGEITLAQWDDLMGTNLRGPLFLAQAAAAELRLRRGLVLNMIDIHGLRPLKRHTVYCAAKAGLVMLTQSLARELGPSVRVNAIAPGPVYTPTPSGPEFITSLGETTPMRRASQPEEIAEVIAFLASPRASYMTGATVAADGGRRAV